MMDHKAFLRTLTHETRKRLTMRDDTPAQERLIFHFGLIILLALYIGIGLPLWWALIPLQGVMIAFLFNVAHEATHKSLLIDERQNDWVGRVAGGMIGLPFEWFRWFHMAHHKYTNDPRHDPELQGGDKPETAVQFAWHVSGISYWMSQARVLVRLATGDTTDSFLPGSAMARTQREAQILLGIYGVTLVSLIFTGVLFWVWLLPVFLGQMALRVFLLAEHADCANSEDMFVSTRTTLTSRAVRWVTWNASYHAEHHAYPTVPFHNLPDLHQLMKAELRVTSDGYHDFTREFLARRAAVVGHPAE
jgi:fatty acid desaturase